MMLYLPDGLKITSLSMQEGAQVFFYDSSRSVPFLKWLYNFPDSAIWPVRILLKWGGLSPGPWCTSHRCDFRIATHNLAVGTMQPAAELQVKHGAAGSCWFSTLKLVNCISWLWAIVAKPSSYLEFWRCRCCDQTRDRENVWGNENCRCH